jgi:hypothetical protein
MGFWYNVWSILQGRRWMFRDTSAIMTLSLLEEIR